MDVRVFFLFFQFAVALLNGYFRSVTHLILFLNLLLTIASPTPILCASLFLKNI